MHFVKTEEVSRLESELKDRFAELNKVGQELGRRQYSPELRQLVLQAKKSGLKTTTICRLSGLSSCTVHRYTRSTRRETIEARRLTIVGAKARQTSGVVVIRLPSGIAIELSDGRDLSSELLKNLNVLVAAGVR